MGMLRFMDGDNIGGRPAYCQHRATAEIYSVLAASHFFESFFFSFLFFSSNFIHPKTEIGRKLVSSLHSDQTSQNSRQSELRPRQLSASFGDNYEKACFAE